jgi:hypothetical protein
MHWTAKIFIGVFFYCILLDAYDIYKYGNDGYVRSTNSKWTVLDFAMQMIKNDRFNFTRLTSENTLEHIFCIIDALCLIALKRSIMFITSSGLIMFIIALIGVICGCITTDEPKKQYSVVQPIR